MRNRNGTYTYNVTNFNASVLLLGRFVSTSYSLSSYIDNPSNQGVETYDNFAFIVGADEAASTVTVNKALFLPLDSSGGITSRTLYVRLGPVAYGDAAHAEGKDTSAYGNYSHAEGEGTIATSPNQHVQGAYNKADLTEQYAHIVGNGTSSKRSNAHTIDWNGTAWFSNDVKIGGTGQDDVNARTLSAIQIITWGADD